MPSWHVQFQNQQGDGDREDTIRERLETADGHHTRWPPLPGAAGRGVGAGGAPRTSRRIDQLIGFCGPSGSRLSSAAEY
jgi:hypothetical protein